MHSTEEVAKQGKLIGDASEVLSILFIITLITYFFDWVIIVFLCLFQGCPKIRTVFTLSGQILSMMLYILLIVFYNIALNKLMNVNIKLVEYFGDNNCSDRVLQNALESYS